MNLTREQLAAMTMKGKCKVVSGLHEKKNPFEVGAFKQWASKPLSAPAKSPQPTNPMSRHASPFDRSPSPRCPTKTILVGHPSETDLQQALIRWWGFACKDWYLDERYLMANPLQSNRGLINGAKMKREGLRKGMLDLQLAVPKMHQGEWCPGLWIEMKTPKGKLSQPQKQFIDLLRAKGYMVAVCHSLQGAIDTIEAYLRP